MDGDGWDLAADCNALPCRLLAAPRFQRLGLGYVSSFASISRAGALGLNYGPVAFHAEITQADEAIALAAWVNKDTGGTIPLGTRNARRGKGYAGEHRYQPARGPVRPARVYGLRPVIVLAHYSLNGQLLPRKRRWIYVMSDVPALQ